MLIKKQITLIILIFSLVFASANITIYNQNKALINEYRKANLTYGIQTLVVPNIPNTVDPSSINLFSNEINFISKELLNNPITTKSILDALIGKNIELVKYNKDGNISFSTIGKLISNMNQPVFEIDGKIVVNPPYEYRFEKVPKNISDYPLLNCNIKSLSKNNDYFLSYIATGLNWHAEYNIYLISNKLCTIDGWYTIYNDINLNFSHATISLVSGDINFNKKNNRTIASQKMMRTASTSPYSNENTMPHVGVEDEYAIFHIPEKIHLKKNSELRYKFLENNSIDFNKIYHITHSLNHYKYSKNNYTEKVPVFVRLELLAENIGDFQIPSGSYKVYNKQNENLTYIGTDIYGISQKKDKIKLEIGKTQDIVCIFNLQGHEINRNSGEFELNVIFQNYKNEAAQIIWTENFSDGRWDIIKSNHDYKWADAFQTEFIINLDANSKKEILITARIQKK